jgi:hypothetical protein
MLGRKDGITKSTWAPEQIKKIYQTPDQFQEEQATCLLKAAQ